MLGKIKLSDFALRHFDPEFGGTKILDLDPKEFEQILNGELQTYNNSLDPEGGDSFIINVINGYAPFCKLLVVENFTDAKTGTLPITIENYQYLRSGYSARRDGEFAVLSKWLDLPMKSLIPRAKYLIIVLYDKNQMNKELKSDYEKKLADHNIDSIGAESPEIFEADYGIVAILGQMQPNEEPMKPITMMRNYMDLSMGGSGMKMPVPPVKPVKKVGWPEKISELTDEEIEYNKALIVYNEQMKEIKDKYQKSIDFWNQNATVK